MVVKKLSLTVDGMNEGDRYWIQWRRVHGDTGMSVIESEFIDTFTGLSLGAGAQLFAHFEREDSLDVRWMRSIVLAPWEDGK